MAKTAAEKQKAYRDRKRNGNAPNTVTRVTKRETGNAVDNICVELVAENTGLPLGPDRLSPLDVYSEQRWTFLQSRGHVWDADRQCSVRPDGVIGATVPGDPGYRGVA